jgi:small-conductance mechanosensitive channel
MSSLNIGLGLTGFALGFALKDFFSNIMSGIMILVYSPFEIGDYITINKIEGEVDSLNLRFFTLKQDNQIHLIPNSWITSYSLTIKKDDRIN